MSRFDPMGEDNAPSEMSMLDEIPDGGDDGTNFRPHGSSRGPEIDLEGHSKYVGFLDAVQIIPGETGGPGGSAGADERKPIDITNFPEHLEVPKGATSLFNQGLAYVLQNSSQPVISMTAQPNQSIIIFAYRLMVDRMGFLPGVAGPVVPPYSFVPQIDESPILPNHGFIGVGSNLIAPFFPIMDRKTVAVNGPTGFDMVVATDWVRCQIVIPAGRTFTVKGTNGGGFDRYMGIEIKGYIANGPVDTSTFSPLG